jgi:endoribonuclease Dicer
VWEPRALTRLLEYEFNNPVLPREAFTHCSWPDEGVACYQRMEFLGDAVLDLLISRHYILGYP